jgi:hypothetical protein
MARIASPEVTRSWPLSDSWPISRAMANPASSAAVLTSHPAPLGAKVLARPRPAHWLCRRETPLADRVLMVD